MTIINKLAIHQFRNLNQQLIEPCSGINLFVGQNAQGKTNLIESIYYLGHNRSFKTNLIKEVIQQSHHRFQIDAYVDEYKVRFEKSNKKTLIEINNNRVKHTSDLTKKLPIQIITPDKGFVVGGTPKNKRSYLDWGVFHVKPDTIEVYKKHNKVLKNINTLLQQGLSDQLDVWLLELAKLSVQINTERQAYLDLLSDTQQHYDFTTLHQLIPESSQFQYRFHSGWPKDIDTLDIQSVFDYLSKHKQSFIKYKSINYGIHKANLYFSLQDRAEHEFSRGEQKTLSIVFWLTQVALLLDLGIKPIVLIDDITSELDNEKIQIILDYLDRLKVQTFITNINQNPIIMNYENIKTFRVNSGMISQD